MAKVSEEFRDLIRELFFAAQRIPKLHQLILHGSVARGEEDKRSDVDLLLIFDTEEDPEKTELADIAHQEIGRAFTDAKCGRRAQLVLTNLRGVDASFIENVAREGITLWGRPLMLDAEGILRPMALFEYRVGGGSRVEKVRFYRALKKVGAKKVKTGLMVEEKMSQDVEGILRSNKIEFKKTRVWLTK
jgi:predicted nucleotidyltransferase